MEGTFCAWASSHIRAQPLCHVIGKVRLEYVSKEKGLQELELFSLRREGSGDLLHFCRYLKGWCKEGGAGLFQWRPLSIWLRVALSSPGTWTREPLEIPANSNCSVSVWCWPRTTRTGIA